MGTLTYIKTLIKDPAVASVTPSSRFAVQRVCSFIDFPRAALVVEYGPGLGVFTQYLLGQMGPQGRLVAIEKNPRFSEHLGHRLHDPRLHIVTGSADKIGDLVEARSADYVISGIPFSLLAARVKERILHGTALALKAEGFFLTYQAFPPPASLDSYLRKPMERHFDLVGIAYEFRNIPPLRIYASRPRALPLSRAPGGSVM
jgi:phospholipid N-methyltransferase